MDELNQVEYAEWLRWCGYCDAEMYTNPLDTNPDYIAGFAQRYEELAMEEAQCHQNMYG